MTLKEGDKAVFLNLPMDDDTEFRQDFIKNKNVILYFYPKDNTPGCTRQACDLRDNYADISNADTIIIGVSKDSVKSHKKFKTKYGLPFMLISDTKAELAKIYGVLVTKSMFGKKYLGIERSTFLIDKNSIIRKIWRKVKVTHHLKDVIAEINNITNAQN